MKSYFRGGKKSAKEILIEFDDSTRLLVDNVPDGLDFSATGGEEMHLNAHD